MPNVSRPRFEYQDCTGRERDVDRSLTPVVACKAEFPVELVAPSSSNLQPFYL
jgi:hypothetical protein